MNAVPLPPVPEVYGIRLPPQKARLTAPNFSLVPRASANISSTPNPGGLEPSAPPSGGESDEGLFGDDIEGEDDDDDEDDDEEMEDVTAGNGGSMSGGRDGKRKASSENEDYD